MSVRVYCGNRLEDLVRRFSEVMVENMPEDPFRKTQIVTHSSGMAKWLRQELAKCGDFRISGNMDILFPGNFFQKWVFDPMIRRDRDGGRRVAGGETDPPFSGEIMKWLIMKALGSELKVDPAFRDLTEYIGGGTDAEIRRYQIASRISGLFDRYMTYRPDMLKRWREGVVDPDEAWQAILWNRIAETGDAGMPYADCFWEFVESDAVPEIARALAIQGGVYFFGVTATPPAHFAMLERISETVPVHFFWMNPCMELWDWVKSEKQAAKEVLRIRRAEFFGRCADFGAEMEELVLDESGNPILGSLGRIGRDLHRLILEESGDPETIFRENTSGTLLGTMQNDILCNVIPAKTEKIELAPNDDSIRIHRCYGPLREIEAFHDDLIRSFGADPDLLPGDVLVYVPDMESYASAIESVFGSGDPYSSRAIPYTIADRTLTQEYPSCLAFLSILRLLSSRFKSSEVLALWSFQEIRNRAGVSDEDWEILNRLLKNARVAWGIDEMFRESVAGYKFRQNSWRYAFDRLIFGAAMMAPIDGTAFPCLEPGTVSDGAGDEWGVAPLEDAEPYSRLIGRFADWMEALFTYRAEVFRSGGATCSDWMDMLVSMAERFLPDPASDAGALALRRTLGTMRSRLESVHLEDMEISWNLAALWVEEYVEEEPAPEKFCRGYVTFCRFQPMRGIPAKIVGMVGMNEGAFPRPDKRLGFDLMDPKKRFLCDRLRRDDDRYAFLEALLAARKRIFISYTGRRDTDRQEMPPSILVEELLSYIRSRVNLPAGLRIDSLLTVSHPLHPFSREYFSGSDLPRSTSSLWHQIAQGLLLPAEPPGAGNGKMETAADRIPPRDLTAVPEPVAGSAEPEIRLRLEELIRFFESPVKYYYDRILGLDLELKNAEHPDDDEPGSLNRLQEYAIRNAIYDLCQNPPSEWANLKELLYRRIRAEGGLPVGECGRKMFDACWDETLKWIGTVREEEGKAGDVLPSVVGEIPLLAGGRKVILQCELNGLRRNGQLVVRPAKIKSKDYLKLAVWHASARVLGDRSGLSLPENGTFVGLDAVYSIPVLNDPEKYLRDLADLFVRGTTRPLCFWLSAAEKAINGKIVFDEKAARGKWGLSSFGSDYDKPDVYTKKVFGEKFPDGSALDEFKEGAEKMFGFLAKSDVSSSTTIQTPAKGRKGGRK
jgi:exodeoxyribonuclease V gamma subunit